MSEAAVSVPMDVRLVNMTTALLLSAVLLTALASALWWVMHLPAFTIRHIVVEGDTVHNSAHSLRQTLGQRLSGNFFTLDLGETRAVFESAPWVRRAVVRRDFPDQISVTLQEHAPAAHWGGEGTHLLNVQGEVFEAASDELDALPRLSGPGGSAAEVLSMYRTLAPHCVSLGGLTHLELLPRGGWRARLGGGAHVELGSGSASQLAGRIDLLAQAAPEVAHRQGRSTTDIEAADMRYPGGFALRLRGISTLTEEAAARR